MSDKHLAADAAFVECARSSGLLALSLGGGAKAHLSPDVESDTASGRLVVQFDTFLGTAERYGSTRPIARVTIDAAELYGDPARLSALISDRVSVAKREIIEQMKATIARLEALP